MIPLRRWSRFSLRTLFLAVTVSAVPLAWITSLYYGYHRALREFSRRHVEATFKRSKTFTHGIGATVNGRSRRSLMPRSGSDCRKNGQQMAIRRREVP